MQRFLIITNEIANENGETMSTTAYVRFDKITAVHEIEPGVTLIYIENSEEPFHAKESWTELIQKSFIDLSR